MKFRNKKITACLLLSTLMLTLGAGNVQAAPADLSAVAAPFSGVSLLVAQANVQNEVADAQASLNLGVAQVDNYLNNVVRPMLEENKEILGMTAEINV